jgi:succinyl-CoA synthetase alpha subunit
VSILINEETQVIIQGITGKQGRSHAEKMLKYNVKVVGGVSPGKAGQNVLGIPVFDTVAEAKKHTRVDATMILVPPAGALMASLEAFASKIPFVVVITEFIPFHDAMLIRRMGLKENICVLGPNTIGAISPGKSKIGVMPGFIYSQGNVGIISRSGTLTHEIASNMTYKGLGQSTCVCIGGDMCRNLNFIDVLKMFREDDETESVVMIGEIGGAGEEIAARYIKETGYPKKIVAFIAGSRAPEGKKMGHAGAIISNGIGTAESKFKTLEDAGVIIARKMDDIMNILL